MSTTCHACEIIKSPKNRLLETTSWIVWVGNNQAYLGRAIVTLKTHKGSLGELAREEWQEFEEIVRKLEPAYKSVFGAAPLNWASLMNHAFKTETPDPHVHWHVFPRYKIAPTFNGEVYEDTLYSEMYDENAKRLVSDEVAHQISTKLKIALA